MPAVAPKSLTAPVPRYQARSRAQEIIDHNRTEVERAVIEGTRRDLVRILLHAQRQIADKMRTTDPEATWTVLDLEQTNRIVIEALATASTRFKDVLAAQHDEARRLGCKNTAELLTHFERGKDTGTVRPLAIREALHMRTMALDLHATSVDRYGARMIQIVRRELQAGIVRGATFHEMTDLLVGKKGPRGMVSLAATVRPDGTVKRLVEAKINKGLFVERRGWAERIVRTEGMRSYNLGSNEEIEAQKAKNFVDLSRKIVATFDARTSEDSRRVHGQVRAVNEPFFDGVRTYMIPPSRPNDRECVIPWRAAWAGKSGRGGTDEGGELTAEELAVLGG